MALVRVKDGKRLHVKSALMGESLVSKEFIDKLDIAPQERLYPDVVVLKIGGQSICDRGAKALPAIPKKIRTLHLSRKLVPRISSTRTRTTWSSSGPAWKSCRTERL